MILCSSEEEERPRTTMGSSLAKGVDYGTRMETNVFNLNVFFTCVSLFLMNSWYVNLQVPTNLGGRGGALLRKIHRVKTFNLNGLL